MSKFSTLPFIALIFTVPAFAQDWAAQSLSALDIQVPGTHSFNFSFERIGQQGIKPYTVYWQQDNGQIHSFSQPSPGLTWWASGGGVVKQPGMTVTLPSPGMYELKAWIKVKDDPNAANDTIKKFITVYDALPKKNVVLEVYKHLECGPCYPLAVYADTSVSNNPNYSVACIYSGDASRLGTPEGDLVDKVLTGRTHPAPIYDRFQFPYFSGLRASCYPSGGSYYLEAYGEREQFYEKLQVYFKSVNYNSATRELKVKIAAKAWVDFAEPLAFNVYLTEDSVKAYQAAAPDPNNYYHKHVLRAMLGGAWGTQGNLPLSLYKNIEHEHEFTYTIPANYNTSKMRLIALVQAYNTNKYYSRIVNSIGTGFAEALAIKDAATASNLQFNIYPNPATDVVKVSFGTRPTKPVQLSLVDIAGKVYSTQQVHEDVELNTQQLAPGTYLLRIDDGQVVHTRNIVKQ